LRRSRLVAILLVTAALLASSAGVAYASRAHVAAASVPIVVVKAKGGATAVFAKVIVHGRAFPFLIDTGATVSVVNPALARRLHLKSIGKPRKICGVAGCANGARRVRLSRWSIAGQPLPMVIGSVAPISGTDGHAFGLLGSDVLSQFGAITIDYQNKVLTLG
jgi:predicted aspartyl protease